MKFRTLRADEIDCRIQSVKPNGLVLLLYKDARCDQNILDETVGELNWQRHHSRDNANCIVSIWDESKKQWIEKEDTGTESYTEKEKGLASDSFKRACFNWGIGRELYTAPFIWISNSDCTIKDGKCFDRFAVQDIQYDNKKIIGLTIVNTKLNRVVFKMGKKPPADDFSTVLASERERKDFMDMCKQLGVEPTDILRQAGWTSGKMTVEHHGKAMIILKDIEESR